MPKKVPMTEKRNWLKQFEDGKDISSIAEDRGWDPRTIKKGIDDAHRERDATNAVSDMLTKALRKHQDSLLELVREIISVLTPISSQWSLPWRGNGLAESSKNVVFQYATSPEPKVLKITLRSESKPEWELLMDHSRRDSFVNGINRWKKSLASYFEARMNLEQKLAGELMSRTGCSFLEKSYEDFPDKSKLGPNFIDPYIVDVLSDYIAGKLVGESVTDVPGNLAVDESNDKITKWKGGPLLLQKEGKATECRDIINKLVEELLESPEARSVSNAYEEMIVASAKAGKDARELLLLDFVPGRCRICHKIGL